VDEWENDEIDGEENDDEYDLTEIVYTDEEIVEIVREKEDLLKFRALAFKIRKNAKAE
jgi:hypothetical protein